MAYITLNKTKLKYNYTYLEELFGNHGIQWAVVSKLLCGNKQYLETVLQLGFKQVCDSRMDNIKIIKSLNPDIETIYIKPPSSRAIADIVQYADISINTEYTTLKRISAEAGHQGKIHKVIIMVELGELREGVLRENIMSFYKKVLSLPHIRVVGIGTNLSCLSGVLPDYDKLNQLVLYKELISMRFNKDILYVSGGSSVTIPLLINGMLPTGINHFRVGETLFFGTDVYNDKLLLDMQHDIFRLYTEIIELEEKPLVPDGKLGTNLEGNTPEFEEQDKGKTSVRAILDIGLLDVECMHIFPEDPTITCTGASSDMLIVNLGDNPNKYKTGDTISFRMNYMGAFRLMNSNYIRKQIVE